MGDVTYITLRCNYCNQMNCDVYPLGSYIAGKEGCTRQVSSQDREKWDHYTKEIEPFLLLQKNPDFQEVEEFYNYIYLCPLGRKLDKLGKAIPTKR